MTGDLCRTFRNGRVPARDQKFESASLQRRVRKLSVPLDAECLRDQMDTRRWGPGERIVFEPYTREACKDALLRAWGLAP